MIKGKTSSGFAFQIDDEARDDMELLDVIVKFDAGEKQYMSEVVERLLGKAQRDKLYDHCRGKSGRVLASKVLTEITSIFDAIQNSDDDLKN